MLYLECSLPCRSGRMGSGYRVHRQGQQWQRFLRDSLESWDSGNAVFRPLPGTSRLSDFSRSVWVFGAWHIVGAHG